MDNLTEKQTEYLPYFVMLDLMQESGQMNMFGAPAKLREIHPGLGRRQAVDVVSEWMKTKTVASDEQTYWYKLGLLFAILYIVTKTKKGEL